MRRQIEKDIYSDGQRRRDTAKKRERPIQRQRKKDRYRDRDSKTDTATKRRAVTCSDRDRKTEQLRRQEDRC